MNRKLNTLLFVLLASVLNIIIMLLILGAALLLLSLLPAANMPRWLTRFLGLLPFPVAIGGSFFIYHRMMHFVMRRVEMDRYFEPFLKRNLRKKDQ